ncbi:glycosyltransferase [Microcoleus sp. B3-A4]|uniref:glycosyltransferase n=1 Tax=Microcoleus sp. B3-A4 TaxID=2818653 RepID=UPI002FCF9173
MTVTAFQQANQLLREGKLEEAVVAYRLAIEQNPNSYLSYQNLGETLGKLGRWEEAVEAYRRAVKLKPGAAWSHWGLRQALQQVGRLEEAQKLGDLAIEIDPKGHRQGRLVMASDAGKDRLRVGVCGWELSHNAAGRAYTLAQLYGGFAEVELIGCLFPKYGGQVWEPIRGTEIPCHTIRVEDEGRFVEQALALVLTHPYEVVHLSKPRMPNIILGLLYKLLWDARVIVDIDDEELTFVKASEPLDLAALLESEGKLPPFRDWDGGKWTRLAVGLARAFDGVTVANVALQKRYGGVVIRHARDEGRFVPSADLKHRSRERFGIAQDKRVVLFFGTPKEYKGLVATARALASLGRKDVVFAIIGDFRDGKLKEELQAIAGVDYVFVGNQPFESIPDVVAVGDVCVLLQDVGSEVSRFQIPAKLSDALGMGLVVLLSKTAAVADVIESGAVVPVGEGDLAEVLGRVLSDEAECDKLRVRGRELLAAEFGFGVNGPRLAGVVDGVRGGVGVLSDELNLLLAGFSAVGSVWSRFWDDHHTTVEMMTADDGSDVGLADHRLGQDMEKLGESKKAQRMGSLSQELFETKLSWNVNKSANFRNSINSVRDSVANMLEIGATPPSKLPITVLIITWDVGHNPLGRSYMLAEVVQRVVRHTVLVGFQFPRYGDDIWEPVRHEKLPVITLPGSNLPEFHTSLKRIAERIHPDVVIACKARFPSVELGLMIKERWNCPLIVDIDDHELSFFTTQTELTLSDLEARPEGSAAKEIEPYGELWTRLAQNLCRTADEIIVSNMALQCEFGGTIIPHVRDENIFNPNLYDSREVRHRYGIPLDVKVVLFLGTPRLHKGVVKLAQAIHQISDQDFRLLIVGSIPDYSIAVKLNSLASNRIICLPNQPFSRIPEILSIADVICLPQEEGHAISNYQLPAKAIDAISMGIPLLVSHTPPLLEMVEYGVAELIDMDDIPASLERIIKNPIRVQRWKNYSRSHFLKHYSYDAAAKKMENIIQRSLKSKPWSAVPDTKLIINTINKVLGSQSVEVSKQQSCRGVDIVMFWKQNDTDIYGRRHDMLIKYLASRSDIRKIIVFDAPISELELLKKQQSRSKQNQDRLIYIRTYEKVLGKKDTDKISYNVFVYPPDKYKFHETQNQSESTFNEDYFLYLQEVFKREDINTNWSIFWIYPKNYFAPDLVRKFRPTKVVVDIIDDHRSWPGLSDQEKSRLTSNYREILGLADMAFANCESVSLSMQDFFPGKIRLVPNGCDSMISIVKPKNSELFEKFCNFSGKTIGYVGNLESKIDINLIDKLAQKFYDSQIVLLGSTHANPSVLNLQKHDNIVMPGVVPYDEVGAWVSRFDVGIVPHLNTELTKNMNPLKVFVYISLNVPVVSTNISNIDRTTNEIVHIASNHEEFITMVAQTLAQERPPVHVSNNYIATNNWKMRFGSHLDELLIEYIQEYGYEDRCKVCGYFQVFEKKHKSLREGYKCQKCKSSLRYQGQAEAIINKFSKNNSSSIVELCQEDEFKSLNIYEPGITGGFRNFFQESLKYYTTSFYWQNLPLGGYKDNIQCQSLEQLTYDSNQFDLIITSDIFEHIRHPWVAFQEILRVLKVGGYHIFSIPVQEPLPKKTVYRVDVSGKEDVYILEPRYHTDGRGNPCLVYTDFGLDIVDNLQSIGYEVELFKLTNQQPELQKLITFVTRKL